MVACGMNFGGMIPFAAMRLDSAIASSIREATCPNAAT